MHKTNKNVSVSYDGMAKNLLDTLDDSTIIKFINYTFSKDFKPDATVTRMAAETTTSNLKQKRCDYFISINEELFLIEIQSYDDHEMAMRMFDYGIRGAILHGKSIDDNGVVELTVPKPVVFYLRKGSKPLEKLIVRLKDQSGNSFEFKADVIYLNDYSFADMIDRYMYPMMPFYSLRYEQILFSEHTKEDEEKILSDLMNCNKMLKEAYKNKTINGYTYQYIREWLINVFRAVVTKAKKRNTMVNDEEAEKIMQMMMDEPIEGFDIFKAIQDSKSEGIEIGLLTGREEGREEGRAEGELKLLLTLSGLVSKGLLTLEQAAGEAGLTVEEFIDKTGMN